MTIRVPTNFGWHIPVFQDINIEGETPGKRSRRPCDLLYAFIHGLRETAAEFIPLRPKVKNQTNLPVCLSSGWPVYWRSDRPRPYRTQPPQWSTRSTWPGGTPHLRPSPPASSRRLHVAPILSSDPSSSSCSSASCPAVLCIVTPHLASQCSSWQTWLGTASGTSHVWVAQQRIVILEYNDNKIFID